MLQGEADRICPLDDNHQLFVALRERGHDVEMVLYPGGKHVMMATMRPDRRVHRLQRVSEFLTKHCRRGRGRAYPGRSRGWLACRQREQCCDGMARSYTENMGVPARCSRATR